MSAKLTPVPATRSPRPARRPAEGSPRRPASGICPDCGSLRFFATDLDGVRRPECALCVFYVVAEPHDSTGGGAS
jgi:hypothetical protein